MLVSNGTLSHVYNEVVHEGMRLGRHLVLDARSLAHTVEEEIADTAVLIRPAEHLSPLPALDQAALGSCTGNAGTYALAARAGKDRLAAVHLDGMALSTQPDLAEAFAVEVYHEATEDDGLDEPPYPPDDRGSSGLGVCRALKSAGLIGGYQWATTLRGVGALLQRAGVMFGTPWFEAWFQPDTDGFVDADPRWPNSGIAGGHEIYIEALEAWDDHDPSKSVIRFRNSWGPAWGASGSGRMRLSTYVLLTSAIDVKQLSDLKV